MASKVDITIKAKDEASGVIDGINDSFGELGTGAEEAEQISSDAFGDIFDSAMDAFVGINQGVELAIKAFDLLKGAYEGTVGKVLEIAGEVEEFVRISGDAPENMSALRLEAEKADVPFDDLYKAMENLNKNGVPPTLDNLVAIADEYTKLEDPIDRARFLTEQFGEAGDEIAPMLEEIAEGVTAVDDAGLIFTDAEIQAAKDYEENVTELKQSWEGFALSIGTSVIPALSDLLTTLGNFSLEGTGGGISGFLIGEIESIQQVLLQIQLVDLALSDSSLSIPEKMELIWKAIGTSNTPDVEELQRIIGGLTGELEGVPSAAENAAAAIDETVESLIADTGSWEEFVRLTGEAGIGLFGLTEEAYNAEKGIAAAGEAADGAAGPITEAGEAAGEAAGGMQAVADATNNADDAMKAYSERLLFKIASEGLSEDAALELAGAMGLVDQKTVAATQQVNFYQDLLAAGVITQAEYNLLVEQLATDLENVPEETPVEVTTNVEEVLDDLDDLATWKTKPLLVDVEVDDSKVRNWTPPNKTGTITYLPAKGGTVAAGGAIHAAASGLAASLSSYWVGERGPEPFFPAMDGRIVSNTQAMAALRGGAGANAREIANAVRDGVREAMRDERGGNVYNLTMPTSSNPADVRTAFELMEAWNA
jgi:hypothetical protein